MDLGRDMGTLKDNTIVATTEVGVTKLLHYQVKRVSSSSRRLTQKYGWTSFLIGLASRIHYASQSPTG